MSRLADHRHRLNFRMVKSAGLLPRLFAVTDEKRTEALPALISRLPRGTGLIFRHYQSPNRHQLAQATLKQCRAQGVKCFIAGDLRLAMTLGADGLHLPEYQLASPLYGLSGFRNRGGLLTAAAHSRTAALTAQRIGVDGLFVSPVFTTRSHPGAKGLGALRFAAIIRHLSCPVFALGGQSFAKANRVFHAGAFGIAGISLFE